MAGRPAAPKMSMRVLLESLGHGEYFKYFQEAGVTMIDGHAHWSDVDVEDIIYAVERRRSDGQDFTREERILLWKALRYMWGRGPGHDCPFIQAAEVPPLFLPKRDWRNMDADVQYHSLDPDRQRQVLRKKTLVKGGTGLKELQFEVYHRQQDIFYELRDIEESIVSWMKSDPRKMLREDPREEAMKLRIRTIMDAASGFLQVRKMQQGIRYRWNLVFLLCRLMLGAASLFMYTVGYSRYSGAATRVLSLTFLCSSGQFLSGSAFMLAFWVAFLVADRSKEDHQNKRFQRVLRNMERAQEDISSFRVESYDLRMEEHEALRQIVSAQITFDQMKHKKQEAPSNKPKRRRRKKQGDKDLAAWAPESKSESKTDFYLKIHKSIEESYRRLPPLPDHFQRNGGDRMLKFGADGRLGGVKEHELHVKAPFQMYRGEPNPGIIDCNPPETRALPMPRQPPLRPPSDVPLKLRDYRPESLGHTPESRTPLGSSKSFGPTPESRTPAGSVATPPVATDDVPLLWGDGPLRIPVTPPTPPAMMEASLRAAANAGGSAAGGGGSSLDPSFAMPPPPETPPQTGRI